MTCILYSTITEPLPKDTFSYYLSQLAIEEQQRIQRFYRWQDAHASLIGQVLIREALQQINFTDFSLKDLYRDDYGKPYLPGSPPFNISHSGKQVVCVASNEDTPGIDVEQVRPIEFEDFKDHFTASEWKTIHQSDDSLASFYDHWCAKEAFIKRDGKGLSNELLQIQVTGNQVTMGSITCYLTYFDHLPGYKMALATAKNIPFELREFKL